MCWNLDKFVLDTNLNLVYLLPKDGTGMPKHVWSVKERTFVYSETCALIWFYRWKLSKMHGLCNFKISPLVNFWRRLTLVLTAIQYSFLYAIFTRTSQLHPYRPNVLSYSVIKTKSCYKLLLIFVLTANKNVPYIVFGKLQRSLCYSR